MFTVMLIGQTIETRRSISGCCTMIFGCTVSWFSRKQQTVTLSSSESELISLVEGIKEALWLKRLLKSLNVNVLNSCNIYEDNQSCLKLIKKSDWSSRRSKHIDTKFKFISECYNNKVLNFVYVPTGDQIADLFTKGLGRVKFKSFVEKLNLL